MLVIENVIYHYYSSTGIGLPNRFTEHFLMRVFPFFFAFYYIEFQYICEWLIVQLFVRVVSPGAFYEFRKIIDLTPGIFSMNTNQINRTTSYKLLRNAVIRLSHGIYE